VDIVLHGRDFSVIRARAGSRPPTSRSGGRRFPHPLNRANPRLIRCRRKKEVRSNVSILLRPAGREAGGQETDRTRGWRLPMIHIIKKPDRQARGHPTTAKRASSRGTGLASKGRITCHQGLDSRVRLKPQGFRLEASQTIAAGAQLIGRPECGIEGLQQRLRLRPPELRRCSRQPRARQPKSGQTRMRIADFDAALKNQSEMTSSLYGRGLASSAGGACRGVNWIHQLPSPWTRIWTRNSASYGH